MLIQIKSRQSKTRTNDSYFLIYIEENNENKYLILVSTDGRHIKKVLQTMEENQRSYYINKQ